MKDKTPLNFTQQFHGDTICAKYVVYMYRNHIYDGDIFMGLHNDIYNIYITNKNRTWVCLKMPRGRFSMREDINLLGIRHIYITMLYTFNQSLS